MPLPPPPEGVTPLVVGRPADFRVVSPDGNPVEVPNPEDTKSGCATGPGGVSAVLMLAWLGLARRRSRSGDTAQDA